MDPRDLHHRLTTAGPDQQRELMVEAFNAVFPSLPSGHLDRSWSSLYARFTAFLDCGAFAQAALDTLDRPDCPRTAERYQRALRALRGHLAALPRPLVCDVDFSSMDEMVMDVFG